MEKNLLKYLVIMTFLGCAMFITGIICGNIEKANRRKYIFKTVAEIAKIEDPCERMLLIKNLGEK